MSISNIFLSVRPMPGNTAIKLLLSGCQDLNQLDVQCDTIKPHFNGTLVELILLNISEHEKELSCENH